MTTVPVPQRYPEFRRYRRPWAVMESSVDVVPSGARITGVCRPTKGDRLVRYVCEDGHIWSSKDLIEMDVDAAAMRREFTKGAVRT